MAFKMRFATDQSLQIGAVPSILDTSKTTADRTHILALRVIKESSYQPVTSAEKA